MTGRLSERSGRSKRGAARGLRTIGSRRSPRRSALLLTPLPEDLGVLSNRPGSGCPPRRRLGAELVVSAKEAPGRCVVLAALAASIHRRARRMPRCLSHQDFAPARKFACTPKGSPQRSSAHSETQMPCSQSVRVGRNRIGTSLPLPGPGRCRRRRAICCRSQATPTLLRARAAPCNSPRVCAEPVNSLRALAQNGSSAPLDRARARWLSGVPSAWLALWPTLMAEEQLYAQAANTTTRSEARGNETDYGASYSDQARPVVATKVFVRP
jgi:hypothetical protein